MKEVIRLDVISNFVTSLNWGLLFGVWLQLNASLPLSIFYLLGLVPLFSLELLPYLSKKTDILESLKILLIYENMYSMLFVAAWFSFDVMGNQVLILSLLVSGKGFNLLGRNYHNKFSNVFNMYYEKRAVTLSSKLDRASTRGSIAAALVGVAIGSFGLDYFLALFALGQTFSLFVGIRLYSTLKRIIHS